MFGKRGIRTHHNSFFLQRKSIKFLMIFRPLSYRFSPRRGYKVGLLLASPVTIIGRGWSRTNYQGRFCVLPLINTSSAVELLSHIKGTEVPRMKIKISLDIGCSFINWHPAFQLTFPINSINVLKIDPELTLLY